MYVQRKLVEKIEKLPVFESKNLHCSNIKLCTSVCFIHKKLLSLKIFQHHFLNLFNILVDISRNFFSECSEECIYFHFCPSKLSYNWIFKMPKALYRF